MPWTSASFTIEEGRTLGIVGESGCGKTTLGRTILRLIEPTSGEMVFNGKDLRKLNTSEYPLHAPGDADHLPGPLLLAQSPQDHRRDHRGAHLPGRPHPGQRQALHACAGAAWTPSPLPERLINTYPHELDGGRRQRVGIARALAMNPKFIVCDEPVSSLDVSIQAQILNLMKTIERDMGITYLFITHDLSVVNHFSDDIAVMYLGRLVEKAPAEALFQKPLHPYAEALLSAIPVARIHNRHERILLKGELTSPINPEPVCRFAARCNQCMDICTKEEPPLIEARPNHFVACHLHKPMGS